MIAASREAMLLERAKKRPHVMSQPPPDGSCAPSVCSPSFLNRLSKYCTVTCHSQIELPTKRGNHFLRSCSFFQVTIKYSETKQNSCEILNFNKEYSLFSTSISKVLLLQRFGISTLCYYVRLYISVKTEQSAVQ